MKKRNIALFLSVWLTILLFFIANQYTKSVYDLNFFRYIKYSTPLSTQEKNFLKEKSTIYYVCDRNAPPFSFINPSTGQYEGLALDYATALSMVLGVDVQFIPMEWNDSVESLKNGTADICDMYPSTQREKYFRFSDSIYWMQAMVATRSDEKSIKTPLDLNGRKIGIPSGDYAVEYVKSNFHDATIIETSDLSDSIRQLISGNVDAIIGDEPVLIYLAKDHLSDNEIKILKEPLFSKDVSLALNKSDTQLLEIINKGIFQLKQQNILQNTQQKWFGISNSIQISKAPERIIIASLIIINFLMLIFILSAMYNKQLKGEVRKRTRELSSSRKILQMTLDALPTYLVAINSEGTILNANEAYFTQINVEKDYIIGHNCSDFPLIKKIYDLYDITSGIQSAIRNKMVEYNEKYFNISIIPLPSQDHILIVANDITNEIINYKQMLQDNKMIAVGQLATGVAHEIRNPLGNIRNYTYILKGKIQNSDEIMEKCFHVIDGSVNRANNIITNLLNFSRINDNNFQIVLLKDVFDTIVSLEKDSLQKNHITIDLDYDTNLQIPINSESLNLILLNLISNSIDAMPEGGMIWIKCLLINDTLFLNFTDSGTGIPAEKIEHIFNPFYSTKKVGRGTGLGLYLVYTEVKNMDGEIQVKSEVGKGTAFKFKIPIKKESSND